MTKILMIRTAATGDVLLTTPLIESIAKKHGAKPDFFTAYPNEEILKNHPFIENILTGERKLNRLLSLPEYDFVYNLQPEARSFLGHLKSKNTLGDIIRPQNGYPMDIHRTDYLADLCSVDIVSRKLILDRREITFPIEKDSLVIHVETGIVKIFSNEWLDELLINLKDFRIYLTGLTRKINTPPNNVISLIGKTSLNELIQVVQQSRVLISPDTAAMHIAGALNVPTVALFGSTPIPVFTIRDSPVMNLRGGCIVCWRNVCHQYPVECMETISVDSVVKSVYDLWEGIQ